MSKQHALGAQLKAHLLVLLGLGAFFLHLFGLATYQEQQTSKECYEAIYSKPCEAA